MIAFLASKFYFVFTVTKRVLVENKEVFSWDNVISIFVTEWLLKFMFSKKATKIDKNLHRRFDWRYVVNVKSMVKILSILEAFLENMNFKNKNKSYSQHTV